MTARRGRAPTGAAARGSGGAPQSQGAAPGVPAGGGRTIKVGAVKLGDWVVMEQVEVPLPGRPGPVLALVLVLAAIAFVVGLYLVVLRPPIAAARDALRMARYDTALTELGRIPGWLDRWPGLGALRDKAALGADCYGARPDWESLGARLARQRAAAPRDADLLVLDANLRLFRGEFDQVGALAQAATQADPDHAEAWYLLGWDRELAGDPAAALDDYRRAAAAAPSSPQYRNNGARALLETGQVDAALGEYGAIVGFPLALIEQALGYWTKGALREAGEAQGQAVRMLDDPAVMANLYNRRDWRFLVGDAIISLGPPADKRCYAVLGLAASRRLAGESGAAFPPADCTDPVPAVRRVLADDLCRFVERPQPRLSATARALRRALKEPPNCPPVPQGAPAGTTP